MTTASSKPQVSIVVPILNEVRYVREAMDCLIQQDCPDMEVIIYDGGSTDGTLEILREYPYEVVVEPGLSQMAAINRGWQRTNAEYVTWMAGDDRYKLGALSRLLGEIKSTPEVAVVHAEADLIDENGKVFGHLAPGNLQFKELAFEFTLIPQTAIIRRSAFLKSGMMDETRRLAADYDLFLRLAQYYPFRFVPFTAADYRLHSGSEDAKNLDKAQDALFDVVTSFFNRKDLSPDQRRLWKRSFTGACLFAGTNNCRLANRKSGWKWFFKAIQTDPWAATTTRKGLGLLLRLISPLKIQPYRLRTFQAFIVAFFSKNKPHSSK
jgi:glycosyltransferase involved in cell wall biosynthesis